MIQQALIQQDVQMLSISKYRELGIKPIWDYVKEVPDLVKYFPSLYQNELVDRAFLWRVLGTLRREAWQQLLDSERKVRGKDSLKNMDDLI